MPPSRHGPYGRPARRDGTVATPGSDVFAGAPTWRRFPLRAPLAGVSDPSPVLRIRSTLAPLPGYVFRPAWMTRSTRLPRAVPRAMSWLTMPAGTAQSIRFW